MVRAPSVLLLVLCLARPSRQGIVDVLRSTQIEVLVDVILVGFNGDGRDALQVSVVLAEQESARRAPLTRVDIQVEPRSLTRMLDLLQDQLARSDDPAPTHRILYRTRHGAPRLLARVESALAAQLDASEASDGAERRVSFHAMDRVVRDDFTNSQSGHVFYLLNPALPGHQYRYAATHQERGDFAEARNASGYLWLDVAAAGALPLAPARGADEAAMTVRVHRAATRYWSPRGPLLLYEPSPWGLGFTVSTGDESASRERAPAIRVHFICQTVCDGGADAALWDWLLPDAARDVARRGQLISWSATSLVDSPLLLLGLHRAMGHCSHDASDGSLLGCPHGDRWLDALELHRWLATTVQADADPSEAESAAGIDLWALEGLHPLRFERKNQASSFFCGARAPASPPLP